MAITSKNLDVKLVPLYTAVATHIFPKFKFINDGKLKYSDNKKSICQRLMRACMVAGDEVSWWTQVKKKVRVKIKEMRSSKQALLKKRFMSKYKKRKQK